MFTGIPVNELSARVSFSFLPGYVGQFVCLVSLIGAIWLTWKLVPRTYCEMFLQFVERGCRARKKI
jgi:hypothetical protein